MNIISSELLALAGILYISLLFYIAYRGDRADPNFKLGNSGVVYSLSLAVYCSSWTFFGAVGTASSRGWDFFAIYLGPILLFLFGYRLIQRIIIISKQQNITSISDFISSRYGKSRNIAVLVTCIAVLGSLPYISLQLQAISMAFNAVTTDLASEIVGKKGTLLSDTAFYSTIVLATFTILFGTRHLNATEHHRGMIQAIAFESVVKLFAILLVGYFSYRLLSSQTNIGQIDWLQLPTDDGDAGSSWSTADFVTRMLLSMCAILLLPRQFHVTVVEADNHRQINTARWMLPGYLFLVSLVVLPIAISGSYLLPAGGNADLYVLNLPLAFGQSSLATLAFIGGLSAATGMVIVAAISLSTMVCNDIVMPMLINIPRLKILERSDLNRVILTIRRIVIILIMLFSYAYYRVSDTSQGLANIGLLSFAAISQFAPAVIAGLYWQQANQRGAIAGLSLGFGVWAYCLLLPNFVSSAELDLMFAAVPWLHPQHLFGVSGLSPLTHGVMWSLLLNFLAVVIGSLRFDPSLLDKIQASIFLHTIQQKEPATRDATQHQLGSAQDARILCERIVGERQTAKIFSTLESSGKITNPGMPVTRQLVQEVERAIASVIGASSARHVVAKTLLGEDFSAEDLVMMMDETSQAISFNRELLEASFENISQGISMIDRQARLVAWNNRFVEMFDYPADFLYVGMPAEDLFSYSAEKGEYGPGDATDQVDQRMARLHAGQPHQSERRRTDGSYIKSQGNPMPGGGFVISYTDITEQKRNEQALMESEQNIRFYTDNLPLMICYVGLDRKVHFSNNAYNSALGVSRLEILETPGAILFSEQTDQSHEQHVSAALAGNTVRFSTRCVDDSGIVTHFQVNYIPQIDEQGVVSGFFGYYQDITQNVAAEDLLRKVNEELEQRVTDRTRDLEQLNNQLQRVTESKTRFLAAASHDLLQPISAARLFNQSMQEQTSDGREEMRSLSERVDHSLVSADKLLRALLDISKLDAGSTSAEFVNFDLYEVLDELEVEMAPIAEQKGIRLIVRKRHIGIRSDRRLLRSMLQNLISNAIRYTVEGSVLVGCRLGGERVNIQVFDTGIGIEKKDLKLIFNEFHRVRNHHKSQDGNGIGLGLAITQRLSVILHHPVSVASNPAHGSCFAILVQVKKDNIVPYKARQPWSPAGRLNGLQVLCVENVEDVLDATRILLNKWGCIVTPCAIAEKAIAALKMHQFDAVLADYSLDSIVTGMDILEQAKQNEFPPLCILVTAEQDTTIRSSARDQGFYFLPKPVDPSSLRSVLRQAQACQQDRAEQA